MGLTIDFLDKRNEVRELIEDGKKAKINWVMTVTQLTFDELEIIANELGFVIKGEFIALPSEAKKIAEPTEEKPKIKTTYSKEQLAIYDLLHCPGCSILLEGVDEKADYVGFCPNCGLDFKGIFRMEKKDAYFQRRCDSCGSINPVKVSYCFRCGHGRLTRIIPASKTAKKIHPKRSGHGSRIIVSFVVSFILSVGLIIWAAVEMTQAFGNLRTGIAIGVIIIGALLLAVPSYYVYRFRLWREYQSYKWFFDDD